MLRVDTVTHYRARYTMRDGGKRTVLRGTMRGIYSKLAWWLITDKHGYDFPDTPRLKCGCADHYVDIDRADCPLHDPETGYYYRLHRRMVRWLENGYIVPEPA